ncbi:hypothetical protein F441_17302 [Phytophthora nicotianae CJ01A1]|uniref:Uncharacterized protein n=2 Tax=Phytophthora nicotianae TaxID=4792 RepID=W2W727_PHYNI|nr:hypothetical protein L915_16955 [Phytophthora nicotianae]ETP06271.1 hypothetical protein F441_17302 [Phytophthora nicotianae CJ01A1]
MRAKYEIQEYAPRGHVDYGTDESAASLEVTLRLRGWSG